MVMSILSRGQWREALLILGPALLVIAGAFWLAFQFVQPAPPDTVTISAGSRTGGYYAFSKAYRSELKKSGITLEIRESAGTVENLERLRDPESGVELALVQGGVVDRDNTEGLMSLGRIYLEPLWIFYRADEDWTRLASLRGKRLAVGGEGSGTRAMARALLEANGISSANTTLRPEGGQAAANALREGTVDAIFLMVSAEAPIVKDLLADDSISLMNLQRAEAYTRLFPYLQKVVLPAGVVDLVGNIPERDISMVAAQAAIVAREDLHPAVVQLMVDAAIKTHGAGGMFQRVNEFPKSYDPEFTVSEDAERLYKQGPPFLRRYLPFWLATFIERSIVMLLPIATILVPLVKIVPWIYQTRIQSRIMYWFRELRDLEDDLRSSGSTEQHHVSEIDRIEDAVSAIPVPWNYQDKFYELRAAVDLVRQRILSRTAAKGDDAA